MLALLPAVLRLKLIMKKLINKTEYMPVCVNKARSSDAFTVSRRLRFLFILKSFTFNTELKKNIEI